MAALTATDWTVSVEERKIFAGQRRHRVKLTLATAGTYPSSGIPMPTKAQLGMPRALDYIHVIDDSPDSVNATGSQQHGRISKYDVAANTLWLFQRSTASIVAQDLVEIPSAVIPGSATECGETSDTGGFILYVEAVGS